MSRTEAETRRDLIDPALATAGWVGGLVEAEYMYRPGRLRLLGEQAVRDEPQFADYVLRDSSRGLILAVVEAKDESHSAGAGLQQALAYAADLGAPFAYSSNGHDIVEQDLRTGAVAQLTSFPIPDDLARRWEQAATAHGPTVLNRRNESCSNPLLQPAFALPGSPSLRYYQERAVTIALTAALDGKHRSLLALATGTGKTFIAFNIAHKFLTSGYAQKILFLADRVSLRDQAYNEFGGFGERRGVVQSGGDLPLHRDVHFAIYQGLYADSPVGGRVFEGYPRDYFDVVIVDECHRSGYGDWGAVLDHFDSAFHLGLTATPKRSDSIDTYAYFGSETLDAEGLPSASYEYSLGRGMDDGFLATYKVIDVRTNLDSDGLHIQQEIERGAELIVPEGSTAQDTYLMRQFEREIVVPDRTRVMCEHLASVLRRTGVTGKTMVFCVTMEHADLVRQEMQRLLGSETGRNLYAARIVSEERDAQATLEQFQMSESTEPIVVTTVDLLTTGVNAPAVRNIVFMKPIASTTVFKQIIGRGSRLDAATGKTFFRIIDYTNATRLLDAWDQPTPPPVEGPIEGDEIVAGRVIDDGTGEPVVANISVRLIRRLVGETATGDDGLFSVPEMPPRLLEVYATASGYNRRHVRVDATLESDDVTIALKRPREAGRRVQISGVNVSIADEIEVDLGDGHELKPAEYLARANAVLREFVASADDLHAKWIEKTTRTELQARLALRQITFELLSLVLARTDADEYDLLRLLAFGGEVRSREERARAASALIQGLFPDAPTAFIEAVLDMYRLAGITEVSSADVFGVPPFIADWGGVGGVARMLGGPEQAADFLAGVAHCLYDEKMNL